MPAVAVVPLVTTRALRQPLAYGPPADGEEAPVGALVRVPLGARTVRGIVVPTPDGDDAPDELKPIEAVLDAEAIPPDLVELALWIASRYGSTPARALTLVLPSETRAAGEDWVEAVADAEAPTRGKAQAVLEALAGGPLPLDDLCDAVPVTSATVRRLARAGTVRLIRRPRVLQPPLPSTAPPLTAAQQAALLACEETLASGGRLLLHGVTGSGKTEVYLGAISRCLAGGRAAIVLVPEIALTPQTSHRIAARFGSRVAVLHSALAEGARAAALARVRSGEADVVVGPRSAILAPLPSLGLVVIDEEHDASYKQADDPRYDARAVAAVRARTHGAALVVCSATPRPETWHALPRVSLPERVGGPLPPVQTVDLRADGLFPISRPLRDRLADLAEHGGRGILLLNRRGEAPALICRGCGRRWQCPDCDVTLSLHPGGTLRCHHCGWLERVPHACPDCGSLEIARVGAGTARIAEEVEALVGGTVDVLRLDADATARRGSLERTLQRFGESRAAVLVGTQMVAKGHDVRDVRLACAIEADAGLTWPDMRAEERTFALLTQLAGRTGRLGDPGLAMIQAWDPTHRVVELAAAHAVEEFLAGELERRRLLRYPPFSHLVRVEVASRHEGAAEAALAALREAAAPLLEGDDILGPAPLFRVRGRHRSALLLKTDRPGRAGATLGDLVARQGRALRRAEAQVVVDVDPQ